MIDKQVYDIGSIAEEVFDIHDPEKGKVSCT